MISIAKAAKAAKAAAALIFTALFPLAAVAPAAATSSWDSLTVDCLSDLDTAHPFQFPLYSYPLNVTLVNCEDAILRDLADSTNATISSTTVTSSGTGAGGSPATMTIAGPVNLEFRDIGDSFLGDVEFDNAIDVPNPDGVLLSTVDHEIPLIASEFTVGTDEEVNGGADIEMAYRCLLVAGPHVYNTASLTVQESANYTMRVTGQSPIGDEVHPNEGTDWWDDSVIIIYSEFDPAHPGDNIVGCGDELEVDAFSPALAEYWWYRTADGDAVSKAWPNVKLTLDAGHYTLVYATYETLTSDDWAAGDDGYFTWDPTPQIITTELWGPEGGAELAYSALASTGVDPSFGLWTGLALAGTGVAITVARRRAQRA